MPKPTAQDRELAKLRAAEWRAFRREFLYSQDYLAAELKCCRRTIASIEAGTVFFPSVDLLRKFRDLKFKHHRVQAMRSKQVA